jgi:hypothetical protein
VNYSYYYQKGGAGVLGALLAWPVHRGLMARTPFGSVLTLSILLVADLVLLRKIFAPEAGGEGQSMSYGTCTWSTRAGARTKSARRRARMQAMVVPTVYTTPGARRRCPSARASP